MHFNFRASKSLVSHVLKIKCSLRFFPFHCLSLIFSKKKLLPYYKRIEHNISLTKAFDN